MRRLPAGLLLGVVLAAAVAPDAARARDDGAPDASIVFLAPAAGPWQAAAEEARFGVAAAAEWAAQGTVADPPFRVAVDVQADGGDGKKLAARFAGWRKDGVALVTAFVGDGRTRAIEEAAEKAKLPLLVLSPEPTRPDLNEKRGVFWAGGLTPQYEAMQVLDYALQPLGSRKPALLHDGSERGRGLAELCLRVHHVDQTPLDPREVAASFDERSAADLATSGADAVLYFGGPAGAEQVLGALAAAKSELPVLLGQGLASAAVPSFRSGAAAAAWAVETRWMEDRGRAGKDDRFPLVERARAADVRVLAGHERGWRAMSWVVAALRAAGGSDAKRVVPALRALGRPGAAGHPVFEAWGHASLGRLELWRSPALEREGQPACHRPKETRVPVQGIPEVGFFTTERFAWEPGTHYVHVFWRQDRLKSIEKDLLGIGLNTKGYESDLEERVLDDLLGRVLSKLNVLFDRNPDGTSIPGVSYAISFGADPPPPDVKSSRIWNMPIGGDDPVAGGRASGNTAWVFSTYIQRTMYLKHKLAPPLSAADREHVTGRYRWDSELDGNLRNGALRSLVDGFSQAMGLTGAHEAGHLAGCGHDTEFPRSIMNVQEGAGLEFDWAQWTPAHMQIIQKRLGRVPAAKR